MLQNFKNLNIPFEIHLQTLKRSTHGSFLSRSKDALAKIAEMTRPISNPTGPRNSRNFVFSTVEKDEGEENSEEPQRPQVKHL